MDLRRLDRTLQCNVWLPSMSTRESRPIVNNLIIKSQECGSEMTGSSIPLLWHFSRAMGHRGSVTVSGIAHSHFPVPKAFSVPCIARSVKHSRRSLRSLLAAFSRLLRACADRQRCCGVRSAAGKTIAINPGGIWEMVQSVWHKETIYCQKGLGFIRARCLITA